MTSTQTTTTTAARLPYGAWINQRQAGRFGKLAADLIAEGDFEGAKEAATCAAWNAGRFLAAEVEVAFAEMGEPEPTFAALMEDPDYLADLEAQHGYTEHVAAGHPLP